MKVFTVLGLIVLMTQTAAAQIDAPDKVLRDEEISEQTLLEALTPKKPIRMRSIKIMRESGEDPAKAAAAKPAQASLLITFETNSAELTARAKSLLNEVGRALQSDRLAQFRFAIEGHADPRGGGEYNQRLSQARAESVVDYLAQTFRIDRNRLTPVGKGDTELLNKSQPESPENRRVTIKTLVD